MATELRKVLQGIKSFESGSSDFGCVEFSVLVCTFEKAKHTCQICSGILSNFSDITVTSCDHIFHKGCLDAHSSFPPTASETNYSSGSRKFFGPLSKPPSRHGPVIPGSTQQSSGCQKLVGTCPVCWRDL